MLFEVPQGQVIVLKQDSYIDAWKDSSSGVVDRELTPEYLVLRPGDCVRLLREPFVECSEADCGYRRTAFARSGEATHLQKLCAFDLADSPIFPIRIETGDISSMGDKKWKRWVLWSGRNAAHVRVRRDDLFLLEDAFCSWRKWEADEHPNSEYFLDHSEFFRDHSEYFLDRSSPATDDEFKSPQLQRMCEAAYKFWGNESVIAADPSTHPSNTVIVQWLLETDAKFTKTAAENAASLIKPTFGLKAGAPEKKN